MQGRERNSENNYDPKLTGEPRQGKMHMELEADDYVRCNIVTVGMVAVAYRRLRANWLGLMASLEETPWRRIWPG